MRIRDAISTAITTDISNIKNINFEGSFPARYGEDAVNPALNPKNLAYDNRDYLSVPSEDGTTVRKGDPSPKMRLGEPATPNQRPPVCIPATGSIYNRMASLLAGTPPMPPAPSPPANDFGKATPTSTQSNNNDDPKPKREQQDIQKLRKEIEDLIKEEVKNQFKKDLVDSPKESKEKGATNDDAILDKSKLDPAVQNEIDKIAKIDREDIPELMKNLAKNDQGAAIIARDKLLDLATNQSINSNSENVSKALSEYKAAIDSADKVKTEEKLNELVSAIQNSNMDESTRESLEIDIKLANSMNSVAYGYTPPESALQDADSVIDRLHDLNDRDTVFVDMEKNGFKIDENTILYRIKEQELKEKEKKENENLLAVNFED